MVYDARQQIQPLRVHAGEVIPSIAVIQGYQELRELHANPARTIKRVWDWSRKFRPEFVVSNLRPGLPCWLGWAAIHTEIPLIAVATTAQLERSPSDVIDGISELWLSASERVRCESVTERDAVAVGRASTVVTISHILGTIDHVAGR